MEKKDGTKSVSQIPTDITSTPHSPRSTSKPPLSISNIESSTDLLGVNIHFGQLEEELRTVSKEHDHFKEQNGIHLRMIADIHRKGRGRLKFVDDSRILFSFWDHYYEKQKLVMKIIKDSIKYSRINELHSAHSLILQGNYSIEMKVEQTEKLKKIEVQLVSKQVGVKHLTLPQPSHSVAKTSSIASNADSETVNLFGKSELVRIIFSGSMNDINGELFDLAPNDERFFKEVNPLLLDENLAKSSRETILKFFKSSTISENLRKGLWKSMIGNSLGITSELYDILKHRLKEHGLKSSIEKLIVADLNRTLPQYQGCSSGLSMFEGVKTLLSLWHIYRPDVGYVQGMSYLMVMLYYYFEDYECFVYFANLILTKHIILQSYTFNMPFVSLTLTSDQSCPADLQ